MGNERKNCLHCGQSLNLLERISEDLTSVHVPGKGEICPNCYRALNEEGKASLFGN